MRLRGEREGNTEAPKETWKFRLALAWSRLKNRIANGPLRPTIWKARYPILRWEWTRDMFLLWLRGKYNVRGRRSPRWTVNNPPFKTSGEHAVWMMTNGYTCESCASLGGLSNHYAYRSYAESYLEPLSGPGDLTDRFAVFCPECHSPVGYDGILDLNQQKRA